MSVTDHVQLFSGSAIEQRGLVIFHFALWVFHSDVWQQSDLRKQGGGDLIAASVQELDFEGERFTKQVLELREKEHSFQDRVALSLLYESLSDEC